jgi:hypothetical protein
MSLETYWTVVAPLLMLGVGAVILGFAMWTTRFRARVEGMSPEALRTTADRMSALADQLEK